MAERYGTPTGDALGTLREAIATANLLAKGVRYGPFQMVALDVLFEFWTSERGDFPIGFFASADRMSFGRGVSASGYCVGSMARAPANASTREVPYVHYLASADVPAAVVPATAMPWVLDDHGSKNPRDVKYHWPTAPEGFHALGTAFWPDNDEPGHGSGACVAAAYLEPGVTVPFWNSSNQGWSHDGSLSRVSLAPATAATAQLRFAPGTLISDEAVRDGNFDCRPWTLVADAPMLPVAGAGPPPPDVTPGSTITAVAILPGLALDPRIARGPFCCLAAVVSWETVLREISPSDSTSWLEVGMGLWDAKRLAADIGARCGARHGLTIPPSANGYVSIDLSAALGIEPVAGATADDEPMTIELEALPHMATATKRIVRQQVVDLVLCDVAGTPITQPYRFRTPNHVIQPAQ
jgi:hypothetical protein